MSLERFRLVEGSSFAVGRCFKKTRIFFPALLAPFLMSQIVYSAEQATTGKIESFRVTLGKSYPGYTCQASTTFHLNNAAMRIKRPVTISFLLLQDDAGGFTHRAVLMNDGSMATSSSDKNGRCISKPDYEQAAKRSSKSPEVDAAAFRKASVMVSDVAIHLPQSTTPGQRSYKVFLYRMELWLDGVLLDAKTNDTEGLRKTVGLPDDWFVYEKHPGKIKYQEGISWSPW